MSSVDFLVNDCSLHGQFDDLASFACSIRRLMRIREIARRYRRAMYCHRSFGNAQVTHNKRMPQAVRELPLNEQRAIMSWLSQHGPFWEDDRLHDGGDWYQCNGEVVTDTAIGEAAHCVLHGVDRGLVSLKPSAYAFTPVQVELIDEDRTQTIEVTNHWERSAVENTLARAPRALSSWEALREIATTRFDKLMFAEYAFDPLQGQPFKQSVAERIQSLLSVLQRLKQSFDKDGVRTTAGQELYQEHFTGDKAWFSDSSDAEKRDFVNELSFPNPDAPGKTLFCSWHGKVKTPQFRVHFSWPVTATSHLYVVYIGPKITKR